ncbi:beta-ketoacyl synthase N-terminal-like domain-containing protein [Luteibacter sp.]|uniref:beta-ketoacyl synthase N-terminal-like domain-containing protein n=1 Tax=Luteibacter sp. TaxID=1886636 RepID=UPI0025BC0562|nr:beta-ketoacyl synthase N-terminal-like domain-containing protein [Luteibacter sp.]
MTGLGVVSAQGSGKQAFLDGLLDGRSFFDIMRREGRQHGDTRFIGAELALPTIPSADERTLSLSARVALMVVAEAWDEAALHEIEPTRVGLVIGGNNVQQREQVLVHEAFRDRANYLRPTYGLGFMDTDLSGACTARFGIRGAGLTVGGASASGQLAIIQAWHLIESGQLDACIAVGALMDLSHWECRGLRALGAMGSTRFASHPEQACRPFDAAHDGFIFGECSAAIVLESATSARRRRVASYAKLAGWGLAMDANRQPDPSREGETRAMADALERAGWKGGDIEYVNPHGTGSVIGDETEVAALRSIGVDRAAINATKSLTGHGLTAAGAVEVAATLLQLRAGKLHPTLNLDNPIAPDLPWVRGGAITTHARKALSLSMGFGGINTALCWETHA